MDKPVPYWIWFCALPFALLHFVQEVRIFRYTAPRPYLNFRVGWLPWGLNLKAQLAEVLDSLWPAQGV